MSINPGMYSSATDQHNTPTWLVERVTKFFGFIELDPCTNPSNPCGARRFYTPETDGLSKIWRAATVYLNPPYGREIIDWTTKLATEYVQGHIQEAIALLPARTDTTWWVGVSDYPVLFVRGRLKFNDCKGSAPFPSALVYMGNDPRRFADSFGELGRVYAPIKR